MLYVLGGALSSAVERLSYTQDVGGSTPSAPTNLSSLALTPSGQASYQPSSLGKRV